MSNVLKEMRKRIKKKETEASKLFLQEAKEVQEKFLKACIKHSYDLDQITDAHRNEDLRLDYFVDYILLFYQQIYLGNASKSVEFLPWFNLESRMKICFLPENLPLYKGMFPEKDSILLDQYLKDEEWTPFAEKYRLYILKHGFLVGAPDENGNSMENYVFCAKEEDFKKYLKKLIKESRDDGGIPKDFSKSLYHDTRYSIHSGWYYNFELEKLISLGKKKIRKDQIHDVFDDLVSQIAIKIGRLSTTEESPYQEISRLFLEEDERKKKELIISVAYHILPVFLWKYRRIALVFLKEENMAKKDLATLFLRLYASIFLGKQEYSLYPCRNIAPGLSVCILPKEMRFTTYPHCEKQNVRGNLAYYVKNVKEDPYPEIGYRYWVYETKDRNAFFIAWDEGGGVSSGGIMIYGQEDDFENYVKEVIRRKIFFADAVKIDFYSPFIM